MSSSISFLFSPGLPIFIIQYVFLKMHLNHHFTFLLLVSLLAFSCNSNRQLSMVDHPNVILILTDDQGWGDLGIHGNDVISTPAIDQMARNGASFERFYVSPLCAPTRASLLTGRYELRTGTSWVSKGLENMHGEEVTIAEIFKENGYATGCFGKWHNGAHYPQHPNRQGFDEFVGFCAGHWNNYFSTTLEHNGAPYPTEGFITDVLTDETIRFIERNHNRNFFAYVAYNVPHSPFQVPDPYFDKYKAMGLNDKDATVYGMCENVDDNVAKIIAKLDDLQLTENTIIIFMTDNGPNGQRYNGGMRGIKGSIHEGGVRVPFIINWHGKIDTKSILQIAGHIDVLPTLATLCNLEKVVTLPLDGLDLSTLLLEKNPDFPERLFFTKRSMESIIPDGAVRSDRYRLVIENGDTMLFDMQTDPGQQNDISTVEKDIVAKLASAYCAWFDDVTGDFTPSTEIRIGFTGEETIYLPAHEAGFSGDIRFMEGHGWAHDWLVNWINTSDSIYWNVVVDQPENFSIELLYSCRGSDIGAGLQIHCADESTSAIISEAHDPEYIPSPDRVTRIEVYEKEWARLQMGNLNISSGDQTIVLKAGNIPSGQVGEIKGLELKRNAPDPS
jgi:arylsulfatase A